MSKFCPKCFAKYRAEVKSRLGPNAEPDRGRFVAKCKIPHFYHDMVLGREMVKMVDCDGREWEMTQEVYLKKQERGEL
jgi:hypothetical protein